MKRFWLFLLVVCAFSTVTTFGQEIEGPTSTMFIPVTITPTEPDNLVSTPRVANDLQLVDSQRQDLKNELARIKEKYQ